jgi:mono/diheme cytochrome c family protein
MTHMQFSRINKPCALALLATAALVGCSSGDPAKAPVPPDEYDLVKEQNEVALTSGPMPIGKAISELSSKKRSDFAALAPEPSEDESALNGWSFASAGLEPAGDAEMPPECAGAPDPMACWGQKLSNAKGCVACHAIDGQRQQPCPNWLGLYGKERPLTSGEVVIADDAYLANSILNSWDQIVEGYGKAMPPYNFPEQEVDALVAYIKSLGEGG